jgi:hypothetical protein
LCVPEDTGADEDVSLLVAESSFLTFIKVSYVGCRRTWSVTVYEFGSPLKGLLNSGLSPAEEASTNEDDSLPVSVSFRFTEK